ncbi:pirin family protein [Burkholderia sp. IMCC1007]|uniref:pirin family protein n=1 Tax=Burkholderia sp. IMCC1007 TaxID=3004104 RepID=UPI0022B3BD10|nr:pirin family protein [Burkholderia sp. IMCC1007]
MSSPTAKLIHSPARSGYDSIATNDTFSVETHLPATRTIVARTAGTQHGPVNRVFSPGDLGELLKPFVFLDYFEIPAHTGTAFSMHPHSGIATTTILLEGEIRYEDTTGASGLMSAGSVEWMNAGGGVWHDGRPAGRGPVRGYQLWIALPREQELAPAQSQYLSASSIPQVGPARVILGHHQNIQSPVAAPAGINYLHVKLSDEQVWTYTPPIGHEIAWVSVQRGSLRAAGQWLSAELAVFSESSGALTFKARGDAEFVLASAIPHPYKLSLGYYSVHTSEEALRAGERRIAEIGMQLRRAGRIG